MLLTLESFALCAPGRIDLAFVLRAFSNGNDGVFIGGCWLGECHYITEGNYDALSMMHLCKKLLEHIGLNPDRLRLEWLSSSEGHPLCGSDERLRLTGETDGTSG